MLEAEARQRIAELTAASERPELDEDVLVELVALARARDAAGRPPTDPAWTPTWDLDRAIVEGWNRKVTLASGFMNVVVGGQSFSQDQIYQHAKELRDQWRAGELTATPAQPARRRRRAGTIDVLPPA